MLWTLMKECTHFKNSTIAITFFIHFTFVNDPFANAVIWIRKQAIIYVVKEGPIDFMPMKNRIK